MLDRALRVKQREEQKLIAENPDLAKELNLNIPKDGVKKNSFRYDDSFIEDDDIYKAMERSKL